MVKGEDSSPPRARWIPANIESKAKALSEIAIFACGPVMRTSTTIVAPHNNSDIEATLVLESEVTYRSLGPDTHGGCYKFLEEFFQVTDLQCVCLLPQLITAMPNRSQLIPARVNDRRSINFSDCGSKCLVFYLIRTDQLAGNIHAH